MRIGQFRAVMEHQVHVPRIDYDVTEGPSLTAGETEDDHLRVDRVKNFLCFWGFRQNQIA